MATHASTDFGGRRGGLALLFLVEGGHSHTHRLRLQLVRRAGVAIRLLVEEDAEGRKEGQRDKTSSNNRKKGGSRKISVLGVVNVHHLKKSFSTAGETLGVANQLATDAATSAARPAG